MTDPTPQVTEWIDAVVLPAAQGWYECLQKDGSVRRFYRGYQYWSDPDPREVEAGLSSDLIGVPGTHWRGLTAPHQGFVYIPTVRLHEARAARRVLLTGR
jgi:hypothetical protein